MTDSAEAVILFPMMAPLPEPPAETQGRIGAAARAAVCARRRPLARRRPPAFIALTLTALALSQASVAWAAGPGRIDSHIGAVVAGSRAVGLGGAVCAIAEGADTEQINPAAVAVRPAAFADEWFDWDFHVTALTSLGDDLNLDMSGVDTTGVAQAAETLGIRLSFGALAVSVQALVNSYQRSALGIDGVLRGYAFESRVGGLGLGYVFADGQWVVGTMIQFGVATLRQLDANAAVHFGSAFAPRSFGVLYAPRLRRFRLGAALQLPVHMTQERAALFTGEPTTQLGALPVPTAVEVGTSLTLGAAWQLLGHPGNHAVRLGEAPTVRPGWRGVPLLIATDVLLYGPVRDGIGVAGYLSGAQETSGRRITVGLRAGAEAEVFERRLRIRTGAYYEPRRFGGPGRGHFTGGADVRLSILLDWRLGVVWDVAPRFNNTGLTLGLWH